MTLLSEIMATVETAIAPKLDNLIAADEPELVALIAAAKAFADKHAGGVVPPVDPPADDYDLGWIEGEEAYPYRAKKTYQVGALGCYHFQLEKLAVTVDEDLWFNFSVLNTNGEFAFNVATLAAHTDQGATAKSWSNAKINPSQVLTWRDHINFSAPGEYLVYLGVVEKPDAEPVDVDPIWLQPNWPHLSSSIRVVVTP